MPMGVHIDAAQVVYVTDQIPRISLFTLDGDFWQGDGHLRERTKSTQTRMGASTE